MFVESKESNLKLNTAILLSINKSLYIKGVITNEMYKQAMAQIIKKSA